MTPKRAAEFSQLAALQPGLITNNRLTFALYGDIMTPEQKVPSNGIPGRDWEVCMTMNRTWGYKSYDDNWKSTEEIMRNLVDIVSKGGNFLLNVGPTAEGDIPQPRVERLCEIGKWMGVNGAAIHETSTGPFAKQLPWGRCTQRLHDDGTTLYLHVFDWPRDGVLYVPRLTNEVRRACLLADPLHSLEASATDKGVRVNVGSTAPDHIYSTVVLEISGTPKIAQM